MCKPRRFLIFDHRAFSRATLLLPRIYEFFVLHFVEEEIQNYALPPKNFVCSFILQYTVQATMSDNVSQDIPAESVDEGVTEDVEPEVATAENAVEEAGSTSDQIEETTESVEPEIVAKQPIETQEVVEDVIPVPDRSAEEVPISNVEEVPVSSVEEVIPPVSSVEEVILPVSAPEVSTTKKPEGNVSFPFLLSIKISIFQVIIINYFSFFSHEFTIHINF